jgi:hypothetical protein
LFSEVSVKEITDWSKLVYFDDPNGTVPVFSALQSTRGRGLLLDRSKGLATGPELISNGTADSNIVGWSQQASAASWSAGTIAVSTIAGAGGVWQDITTVAGKWYRVMADSISAIDSSTQVWVGGGFVTQITPGQQSVGTRKMVLYFQAIGVSTRIYLRLAGTGTGAFDNVSVKEVLGNHMAQPTSTARGEISKRVNALIATEDLTDAIWVKTSAAPGTNPVATKNYDLSPLGTMTASRLQMDAGSIGAVGLSQIRQNYTGMVVGQGVTYKIWLKSLTAPVAVSLFVDQQVGVANVTTEWQQFTVTTTATAVAGEVRLAKRDTWGTAGVADILVWGADVRPTADAIPSIPSYQAVRSATDYDEVGFPAYWRGQTDDWAKARINPNGATKVEIFTSIQKMSDSSIFCVLEHSVNWPSVGAFALFAPGVSNSPGFGLRSSGQSGPGATVNSGGSRPAPIRAVVRGSASNASDYCRLFINGEMTNESLDDQGTGTYTEQDTYFGARAGTTLFANYREYAPPLIIFMQPSDPGLSAAQIKRLQRKFAKAIGVTL